MDKEAKILDMGCGAGAIGEMLHAQSYTNIFGTDASEKFTKIVVNNGWYKEISVMYHGMGVDKLP